MDCQLLLTTLQENTLELKERIVSELRGLGEAQYTWRPNPQTWNVIEGVEHLNLTLQRAFEMINPAIERGISEGMNPTTNYSEGWIGELAVQLMDNSENRKFNFRIKTSKGFNPIQKPLNSQKVLNEFEAHLTAFHQLLEKSRLVPLGKVRLRVIPGTFVRFRLGDILRFFYAHTERHFNQMMRLQALEGFPSAMPEDQTSEV